MAHQGALMKPYGAPQFVRELLVSSNLEGAEAAAEQVVGSQTMDMLPDAACEESLRALVRELSPATTHLCLDDPARETVLGGLRAV